jgi:hypothetical protein
LVIAAKCPAIEIRVILDVDTLVDHGHDDTHTT